MKTSLVFGIILIVIGLLGIVFCEKILETHVSDYFSEQDRKVSIRIASVTLIIAGIMVIVKMS